ncbi:RuvC-like Holliday junction resolvase [Invertebrate iridovirus 25]|uniref:RuvC-like Holliday junction resolvase n=1 Tax=Invertebrate iridovirus 25 TaxID=1301280 RepID=W8W1K9_9VIRU|nr:RuvC-like Holliday junction resolvase [Invertebrate iridovirus 25]CCV02128.1 RuvC-like Holliday junction resolvase [Invertebrate iridovirus 25]
MIAAFDLGRKNFAFAVKDKDEFILLKNINLDEQNMTKTDLNKLKKDELVNMMENLSIKSTSSQIAQSSISSKLKKKEIIDCIISTTKGKNKPKDIGISMFQVMDEYKEIWEKCNVFLIERQMTINLQALKLSHYLEAYLKIYYPNKKILNYSASKKTKKLGAPTLKTKRERKAWTTQFTSELLTDENLKYFQSLSKKDDIADVVCMIESYY